MKTFVVLACMSALIVAAGAGMVMAQGPQPQRPSAAAGTAFTYQGQLKQNGSPVNGTLSLTFKLYSVASGGSPLGTVAQPVTVSNGLFTTLLDFGSLFDGSERWLGISIGSDPELTPRQTLTAVPYALFAEAPWATSGSGVYYNNGKVGIGITLPVQLLHMNVITGQGEGIEIDSPVTGHAPAIYLNHTGPFGRNFRIASYSDNNNLGSFRIRDENGGVDRLVIDAFGNIGAGTSTPSRRLDVNGVVGVIDANTRTFNAGVASEGNSQLIDIGINDDNGHRFGENYTPAWQGGFLRVDARGGQPLFGFFGRPAGSTNPVSNPLVSIDVAGKLTAVGGFNGTCRNDGMVASGPVCNQDVAEAFVSAERTAPGDLVTLVAQNQATPTVRKANRAYDDLLIGVVSQNPGLVFDNGQTHLAGDNSRLITDRQTVVALVGRVLANVTLENGPIAAGDPLTSASTPGAAMKATHAGKIIGYALEAAEQDGQALVLLQPGTYLPADVLATQTENTQLKARIASLEEQNLTIEARLSALERATPAGNMAASPAVESSLLSGLLGGGNIASIFLAGLVVVLLLRNRKR